MHLRCCVVFTNLSRFWPSFCEYVGCGVSGTCEFEVSLLLRTTATWTRRFDEVGRVLRNGCTNSEKLGNTRKEMKWKKTSRPDVSRNSMKFCLVSVTGVTVICCDNAVCKLCTASTSSYFGCLVCRARACVNFLGCNESA